MFTGIITHLGTITRLEKQDNKDVLLHITTPNNISRNLDLGCSIAINGICLTLIQKEIKKDDLLLSFQASDETCEKTTLNHWQEGQEVNLEFALRMGDELGGHMVLGHIDTTAKITAIEPINDSHQFRFETDPKLMKFIVEKGSVTLDGTSLTVNQVNHNHFSINIIQHTINHTIFKQAQIGTLVNLEIDAMARYAAKILIND